MLKELIEGDVYGQLGHTTEEADAEYGSLFIAILVELLGSILGDLLEDCDEDEAKKELTNPSWRNKVRFRRDARRATRRGRMRVFREQTDDICSTMLNRAIDENEAAEIYRECCQ